MTTPDLEAVRAEAKELGLDYHPAMKAETIQKLIDAHKNGDKDKETPEKSDPTEEELEDARLKDALALIPVTITSMDPADSSVTAVTVSVGNRKLGQITKVIPFGHKWYMPRILVDHLKAQQFCRSSMIPVPGGLERLQTQWIQKYAIQKHPLPSPQELADLAKLQLQGNELAK
jgi:hypothetical protein